MSSSSPTTNRLQLHTGRIDGPDLKEANSQSPMEKDGNGDVPRSIGNNHHYHEAFMNNSSNGNKVDTLKPEDGGLGPSLIEVRFVDDEPDRDGALPTTSGTTRAKEKIGHRRVDKLGEVSYKLRYTRCFKRVPTNALMGAIQLGIANSIGTHEQKDKRDILVQDFRYIDLVAFPSEGSQTPHTPPHNFGDFRFKSYAPIAFRYFRELFKIKPADFLFRFKNSLCSQPLQELSNPGASGSIFYVSADDKFIIKTIQHKEAEFLRTLLPGYYINLVQNPRTLLPKFFGLFCYQTLGKNIRLLVMNNLLPQAIMMNEKFDLKGSTYKRAASHSERAKANPTLKDLDFNDMHKTGLLLEPRTYDTLMDTIKRDCLVLESFEIMDYSILIGIHNIDLEANNSSSPNTSPNGTANDDEHPEYQSSVRTEAWKSLQLDFNTSRGPHESGGLPARNAKGEQLLVFLGIIDILQSYRLFKKLEHTWKSVFYDGEAISVCNPTFYATRFQAYLRTRVFTKSMAIKQAPARPLPLRNRSGPREEGHEEHPRLEMEPTISQRGAMDRRSYTTPFGRAPTVDATQAASASVGEAEKRRKKERLFANTESNE